MEVDDVESVDKSKTSEPTLKPAYPTTPKLKEVIKIIYEISFLKS